MPTASRFYVSWVYLTISLVGLFLLPILLLNPPQTLPYTPLSRQIIGLFFITICMFGVLAALSPRLCRLRTNTQTTQFPDGSSSPSRIPNSKTVRRGHHPICPPFTTHTLQLPHHTLCAGCTGLALGAVLAIAGSISYFLLGFPLPSPSVPFMIGFWGVAIGLSQHLLYRIFPIGRGLMRTIINAYFVISVFFLLAAIDGIAHSLLLDLYLLCLTIYWINTRIKRSQSEHAYICQHCPFPACINQETAEPLSRSTANST